MHSTPIPPHYIVLSLRMEGKELVKIKPHAYFTERFYKKLAEPISVVEPLTSLCGGCKSMVIKGTWRPSNK